MKEIPVLKPEDIEVKVKKATEKGVVVLLYKTARIDMAILDETFGPQNWCCDYKEIKGNLYCGIGVRFTTNETEFVWKWDCGIESRADNDGNQKKGEASDAFKRAGTKWGIGRELYTAPRIFIAAETYQDGRAYKLKDRYAVYSVSEIAYTDTRRICSLKIVDRYNNPVYTFGDQGSKGPQTDDLTPRCFVCGKEFPSTPSLSAEQAYQMAVQKRGAPICRNCWEVKKQYAKNHPAS